jgi:RNA polymerase-binding transcription factor DksA
MGTENQQVRLCNFDVAELERQLEKLQRSMLTTSRAMKPVQLDQSSVGRLAHRQPPDAGADSRAAGPRAGQARPDPGSPQTNEGGTYGTCVICGQPVAFERLMVFHEAPNCAACAGR